MNISARKTLQSHLGILVLGVGLLAAPVGNARADACVGVAHCFDAGSFAAEVTSVSPTWNTHRTVHYLRLNFRVRNTGAAPITLGFPWKSASSMTDNYGNPYAIDWRYPQNISGIGIVGNGQANTTFTIEPGGSRTASLVFFRVPKNTPVGNLFAADFPVEELKAIPGQQRVNVGSQYSLNFTGLAGGVLGATNNLGEAVGNALKAFSK